MHALVIGINPFLWELVIFPLAVIGLGLGLSLWTRKAVAGLVVPLFLAAAYDWWAIQGISAWVILLPIITFALSYFILARKK
ncbi:MULTISPECIES: hypothetical protein [Bacillaceae]|uniref:Uncharacterized protein n=1 Tax=Evansella alkalicola TaxID=745819 RepID=A0ABS6K283_9BACI|nr:MULTISPECIES: hypothetical protein [Bacillaceae]MBU9724229.1 hypothetical protein [Bacillus alkalicola]